MRKFIFLTLGLTQLLCAQSSFEQYLSYIKAFDETRGVCTGDYQNGEIQIVTDPIEIARIEEIQAQRLIKKGFSKNDAKNFSHVGIISEDQYWIWLRDAVYFPKGVPGTYDRLIWKNELKNSIAGVAVLPILASGKIVLNLNYRHATRSWELELPRGGLLPKEKLMDAAQREIKEETGMIASELIFLGTMAPDTGMLSAIVPILLGKITQQQTPNPEYSEAIAGLLCFSKEELKQGLLEGFLEVPVNGIKQQVPLRDSFLTFALLQAQFRGLI